MEKSLFSTKDIVKYLIVMGLIYSILKMIPSQQIADKDLILIMVIITVGVVSIDCMFFKKIISEGFNNISFENVPVLDDNSDIQTERPIPEVVTEKPIPEVVTEKPIPEVVTERPITEVVIERPITEVVTERPITEIKVGCALEVDKVKRQLEDKIEALKVQLQTKSNQPDSNDKIATRYFKALITELVEKGIIDTTDVENIKLKTRSKLLTIEEVISSLENIKVEGKTRVNKVNRENNDDTIYNELPSDFSIPIGDKIANEWDNEYTILNTNKWQVPMTRPPICINNTPCNVCPTDSSSSYINLKQWNDSRYVTSNKVNKKWAQDQSDTQIN